MAEGEQGFLGLTHNPFTSDNDEFFPGGDRKTHLDQLRHLNQWSRSLMLVTGPQGVGKTMLYRQLSMTLEPRVKAARINGLTVNSAKDVLAGVVHGFGAVAAADANVQLVAGTITTYVINQDRQGRYCLVMVDDAHRLSFGALEELLKLSKSCPVRVLMFGEPSIVGMVAKSADRLDVEWHEMRLTGYSEADIEGYLTWRFEQAQYRDKLPFSSDQVAKLSKVSGGLPGEIDRIAGDLVARLESGESADSRRFPIAHRLLIVLLIAVVGLAYLVFSDSDARREKARQEVAEVTEIQLPQTEVVVPAEATPPVEEISEASGDSEPAEILVDPVESPVVLEPETVPDDVAEESVSEGPATQTPIAEAEPLAPDELLDELPAEVEQETVTANPVERVPVVESSPTSGSLRDAAWLLEQPSDFYTIQLVSVSSLDRVRAFVDRQQEPGDFAWYSVQRGERTLYVITYGLFTSLEAARSASQQMPPEVGDLEPWIRQMKFVQDAAR